MLGVAILLGVLAVPYLLINLRRLVRGQRWAYTFCHLARDWEERSRAARAATAGAGVSERPNGAAARR